MVAHTSLSAAANSGRGDLPAWNLDHMSLVAHGSDRVGRWELYDGKHQLPQDPLAVEFKLFTRYTGRCSVSVVAGVGPPIDANEFASIGISSRGFGGQKIGHIRAQCTTTVSQIRITYSDGNIEFLNTKLGTTGQRWALCPFDRSVVPLQMTFIGEHGKPLIVKMVTDPYTSQD